MLASSEPGPARRSGAPGPTQLLEKRSPSQRDPAPTCARLREPAGGAAGTTRRARKAPGGLPTRGHGWVGTRGSWSCYPSCWRNNLRPPGCASRGGPMSGSWQDIEPTPVPARAGLLSDGQIDSDPDETGCQTNRPWSRCAQNYQLFEGAPESPEREARPAGAEA